MTIIKIIMMTIYSNDNTNNNNNDRINNYNNKIILKIFTMMTIRMRLIMIII